ncbi:MAG: ATP-binding protein [Promethearchaeota archaeon]
MINFSANEVISQDFKKLLKKIPSPAYLWKKTKNNDFVLIEYNKKAEDIIRRRIRTWINKGADQLLKEKPEMRDAMLACFEQKKDFVKKVEFSLRFFRFKKYFLVNFRFMPPDMILVYIEDLVEQKKIIKNLLKANKKLKYINAELEKILDFIPVRVFYKDNNNRIIRVNRRYSEDLNMKKEDLEGKSCFELYPKEIALKYWHDDLEIMNTGCAKLNYEEPWISPKGKRWVLTSKIPFLYSKNNIIGVIGFAVDITEQKFLENELKKSRDQLKQVNEKLLQVKEAETKYRKAFEHLSFYKDLVFHDINNIFNNMHLSARLHEEKIKSTMITEEIKKFPQSIIEQVIRGMKLISNVRAILNMKIQEIPLQEVDLILLLSNALNFIEAFFQHRTINITTQYSKKKYIVLANELLQDVFENLLINAIHHNQNEIVQIEIVITEITEESKKHVKMEFKDNGMGISEELKKNLFVMTPSQDIRERKAKGFGLKLVKKLMDIYNGKIIVEDRIKGKPSEGTNFILFIPALS